MRGPIATAAATQPIVIEARPPIAVVPVPVAPVAVTPVAVVPVPVDPVPVVPVPVDPVPVDPVAKAAAPAAEPTPRRQPPTNSVVPRVSAATRAGWVWPATTDADVPAVNTAMSEGTVRDDKQRMATIVAARPRWRRSIADSSVQPWMLDAQPPANKRRRWVWLAALPAVAVVLLGAALLISAAVTQAASGSLESAAMGMDHRAYVAAETAPKDVLTTHDDADAADAEASPDGALVQVTATQQPRPARGGDGG